jgi:hypothetical protein
VTDHNDLPDLLPLARDLAARARVDSAPLGVKGRVFWKLATVDDGELAWLALTRPDARAAIDRRKVWTLIPQLRVFLANWFATVDRERTDQGEWVHTIIDIDEARDLVGDVPEPTAEDMRRITRPQAVLTLDQIDRYPVAAVLGKRADDVLKGRR